MKLGNFMKKPSIKNVFVALLIAVVHVVALFSSPFFLGTSYSKAILIDEYCKSNVNGSSLIVNSDLSFETFNYENVDVFRKYNDSELNTATGIASKNAVVGDKQCHLVGASKSETSKFYNKFRVYSDYDWGLLETGNYVFIPESMISQFAPKTKEIKNIEIDIYLGNKLHTFKIGGSYSTYTTDSGWRSRGSYLNNTFENCIFVGESFLVDKYDCVFEMITSDSSESGNIYDRFTNTVKERGGNISEPKNLKEIKLLNELNLLSREKRNKVIQLLIIVAVSLSLIAILCLSVFMFSVNNIKANKRGLALFIWSLAYYVLSCIFVLIVRSRIIKLLGFSAYGANKALLNMVLIFFILFFVVISIKTFVAYKKDRIKEKNNESEPVNSVLFVTKAKFPNDNAFATYISGIASVYKKAGFDVICIGNGYTKKNDFIGSYFGRYVSVRNNNSSFVSRTLSQLLYEFKVYHLLENNFKKPNHIFFSCEFSLDFYSKVKKLYSDTDVSYSFIVTEQYTKDEFEKYNVLARKSLRRNRYLIEKYYSENDSFITISRYLSKKIEDKKMKCAYVPFSFNRDYIASIRKGSVKHNGINYIYCGSPENKDLLPTIINAFSSVDKSFLSKDIHLNIIGAGEEWATKHGITSYDKEAITFFGRQKNDFVMDMYAKSDYAVLLRDEEKVFAKAGFPTKISEAMTFGVVPITNLSSNLCDYLNDDNSIIVKGHELEEFVEAIKVSIAEFDKIIDRKNNSVKTAESNFNIDSYEDVLLSLINDK